MASTGIPLWLLWFMQYLQYLNGFILAVHDDVIKWKHFSRYWPFVRGIYRPPVNSPHKGQWRGALMFSLICTRINIWVNNREAGDLRRHRAHYDVIVTCSVFDGGFFRNAVSNECLCGHFVCMICIDSIAFTLWFIACFTKVIFRYCKLSC